MEKRAVIIPDILEPILTDRIPEEFLGGLPTMVGYREPLFSAYVHDRDIKRRKKYAQPLSSAFDDFDAYVHQLEMVMPSFLPLFSSYDKEIILPSTCALGWHRAAHTDMDEKGGLGRDRHFMYDSELLTTLVRYYQNSVKKVIDEKAYSLSAPRGKNTGYPTPKASRSRECADVLLFFHSAIAIGARKAGLKLSDLDLFMQQFFGQVVAIAGERQQTKDTWFFEQYQSAVLFAKNFFFRVRGIYFSPKYKVLSNRLAIKPLQNGILATRMHDQDRSSINDRIKKWGDKGWLRWSKDVSKFDQSHGGPIGEALLRLGADILLASGYGEDVFADFRNEFFTPMLLADRNGMYLSDGGEILSSGVSMTTTVNCLASHAIVLQVMARLLGKSYADTQSCYERCWDAITFGDDIICAIDPSQVIPQFRDDIDAAFSTICSEELDLTLTTEPTLKFLGQNYDMLSYRDATCGYPVGRFFQQQFFPERKKKWPFSTIGYVARLDLLDSNIAPEIHKSVLPFFSTLDLGAPFPFAERHRVLASLLPEVEKYAADVAQLDDVLGVLGHGLDPDDLPDLFSSWDESFKELLSLGYIDVSKPSESLRVGQFSNVSRGLTQDFARLEQGDLSTIPFIISQIRTIYGGEWKGYGEMYF